MSRGQGRTYGLQHGKSQVKRKAHDQQQAKQTRRDLLRIQETIFALSPLLLKNFVDLLDDEMANYEPLPDTEGTEIDYSIDQAADLEVVDEDEFAAEDNFFVGETPQNLAGLDYGVLLGDAVTCKESAVFLPSTVYTIIVVPAGNGHYRCRFEGSSWFNRRLPDHVLMFIRKLRNFIAAIAKWLEEEKQDFLQEPVPGNFVLGEAHFLFDPVVQQEGFLNRVNTFLSKEFQVDESAFSRLRDNIWLVWPEWNMPLKNIFTKEFSRAWLVEVCTAVYIETSNNAWLNETLRYPDFGIKDIQHIKKQAFDSLDPEEKLHLLRDKVGCDIGTAEQILQGVIANIRTLRQDER